MIVMWCVANAGEMFGLFKADCRQSMYDFTQLLHVLHRVRKKRGHIIFNYNSRIY